MKKLAIILALGMAGCSSINDIDSMLSGVVPGVQYVAPTLGGYPQPSGCQTSKCKALDQFEAELYVRARAKQITWVNLVDRFYKGRAELFPDSSDAYGASELRAYQRALAEQMDLGKITESQWAYFIEKRNGEINARNELLHNSAPRPIECTSTSSGARLPRTTTICK